MAKRAAIRYIESFHPGTALAELMSTHGMELSQVAEATGASLKSLRALIRREVAISEDLVVALAQLFKRTEDFWRNLQTGYERELAREEQLQQVAGEVELLKRFRSKEAAALGWIPARRDKREMVLDTREFLGVATLRNFRLEGRRKFRITGGRNAYSPGALGMWLRQGEIEARKRDVGNFDPDTFRDSLVAIRKFTMRSPFAFLPAMTALCAKAGVVFLIVENIPSAGAKGATCWRADGTPWIQMNFKGNWLDSFWFTFFHEAAHVLQGKRETMVHVDGDPGNGELDEDELLDEMEADRVANDILIPKLDWNAILAHPNPTADQIEYHASKIGIHPGIIVGRLQDQEVVEWWDAGLNQLKTKVTLTERKALSDTNIWHQDPEPAFANAA